MIASLLLASVLTAQAPAPPPPALSAESAESAEEVLAKYAAARGGLDRWKAVESIEMTGTYTSFSEDAPLTLQRRRPDLYRFESAMLRKRTVLGSDGKEPWLLYPLYDIEQPTTAEEPLSTLIREDAEFEPSLLRALEKGHKVELDGKGDIDGQETLRIKLTRANGKLETWHLDPKTYLEVAVDSRTFDYSQSGKDMAQRTYFSEFRRIEGLVFPFRIEKEYGARHAVLTFDKVQLNHPLADTLFKKPTLTP